MRRQADNVHQTWRPSAPEELILWDIIDEHLEGAGFLWTLWESTLVAPDYTLQEVAQGEEIRMLAHIRGLVVGGEPVARRVLIPALAHDDPELVFAAALALLMGEDRAGARVLGALVEACDEGRYPLVRALQLARPGELIAPLRELLSYEPPQVRAAALDVLASYQVELPDLLGRHLSSVDPAEVSAGLRAARLPCGALFRPMLEKALYSDHPQVRDEALVACLIHGPRDAAWNLCHTVVVERRAAPKRAMLLLALLGDAVEQALLEHQLVAPDHRADALYALGYHGTREVAEMALGLMADPELARLAAEAFCAVTGLDLQAAGMTLPAKEERDEPIPLDEEDLDEDLTLKPEDALPLPDPEKAWAWWDVNEQCFQSGIRYICGAPHGQEALLAALESGPMRRRHVLALELLLQSSGTLCIGTNTLRARQVSQMPISSPQ